MAEALGSGDYRYEPVPGWGRLSVCRLRKIVGKGIQF